VKWFFILLALGLLAIGVLWQNGVLDPRKWLGPERVAPPEEARPEFRREIPQETGLEDSHPASPASVQERSEQGPSPEISMQETPEERPSPEVAAPATEAPRARPYSLHLGSFRTMRRVDQAMALYGRQGLLPYWVKVELGGKGTWYRVFAGQFEDEAQAEAFRQSRGLTEATVKSTPYANLIGDFVQASGQLEERARRLRELGYSPYVLTGPQGRGRLFVGAFFSRSGATGLQAALQTAGIESRVVER
jgi:cell division protein FtsN